MSIYKFKIIWKWVLGVCFICSITFGYFYKHKIEEYKFLKLKLRKILQVANEKKKYWNIPDRSEFPEKLEKQLSSPLSKRKIDIKIRKIVLQGTDSEHDFTSAESIKSLDLKNTALLLIDTWEEESQPNLVFRRRMVENMNNKLLPLIDVARQNRIKIIFAHGSRKLFRKINPRYNDLIIGSENHNFPQLIKYLKDNNISTLLYAGYGLNMCVLVRNPGIINMHRLGYKIILIRDCTIAVETSETFYNEWSKKVGTHMVEYLWGSSTTLDDLSNALN